MTSKVQKIKHISLSTGLIVFPTAIINSTPLQCTICTKDICDPSKVANSDPDGNVNIYWLKNYCTFDPEAVDQFLLYFPYVLLIVAILLFLIERAFNTMFNANKELEIFHNLLVEESIIKDDEDLDDGKQPVGKEDTEIDSDKLAFMVSQGSSSNYFRSYTIRTISELIVASALFM